MFFQQTNTINFKWLWPLILAVVFFVAAFFTLSHYGISWDETIHFRRGQAYLYYFLTGKDNYQDLPNYNLQGTNGDPKKVPTPRRSLYQDDLHNGRYMLENDSGHPPLNDELAALFNYLFYQRLGIVDDVGAHHLFIILTSALLIFITAMFAGEVLGTFYGVVAAIFLATYPLFWAESHFNIKDPVETAFFAGTIWAFWKSLQTKRASWLITSSIFFALALGTKFNILFVFLILLPYLIIRQLKDKTSLASKLQTIPKSYLIGLIISPFIVLSIFFISWPYLWHNLWPRLLTIIGYYQNIGSGDRYQPDSFYLFGFNLFPIIWIFFTTPPLVLISTIIGIVVAIVGRSRKKEIYYLWLIWFLVPVLRVSLPKTVIYGGVRQIMEFLPAMVLLSCLGAKWIFDRRLFFRSRLVKSLFLVVTLLVLLFPLYKLHPDENVYFNFLVGGLKGARVKNFPSWGNTFGNAYLSGIKWLNANAEENANLALIQGTPANAPVIYLRRDINYNNSHLSGIHKGGEYLMELTFNDTGKSYYYAWEYVTKFLKPVYEYQVEGVTLLTIWKNDDQHTRFTYLEQVLGDSFKVSRDGRMVILTFNKTIDLSRIIYQYSLTENCQPIRTSFVETSLDGGRWKREKDWIPFPQIGNKDNLQGNTLNFYLAGKKAKFIRFVFDSPLSCGLNNPSIKVMII